MELQRSCRVCAQPEIATMVSTELLAGNGFRRISTMVGICSRYINLHAQRCIATDSPETYAAIRAASKANFSRAMRAAWQNPIHRESFMRKIQCPLCRAPESAKIAIDAIMNGDTIGEAALRVCVKRGSVRRHMEFHTSAETRAAIQQARLAHPRCKACDRSKLVLASLLLGRGIQQTANRAGISKETIWKHLS